MPTDEAVDVEAMESLFDEFLEDNRNELAESTLCAYRTRFTAFRNWYIQQKVRNSDR